jgi:hypothetical protein
VSDGGTDAGHLVCADRHPNSRAANEEPAACLAAGHGFRDVEPNMGVRPVVRGIRYAKIDDLNAGVRLELLSQRVLHLGAGIVGAYRHHVSLVRHVLLSSLSRHPNRVVLQVIEMKDLVGLTTITEETTKFLACALSTASRQSCHPEELARGISSFRLVPWQHMTKFLLRITHCLH